MNSTQPAKFPLLQEMLLLEDSADHDIMGGVKQVLDRIRGGWRSNYDDVTTKLKSAMKKLTPTEQQKIINFSTRAVDKLIDDVAVPIPVTTLVDTLYTKQETAAAYLMFASLSAGAEEIHKQFMLAAVHDGYITNDEAQEKIANVKAGKFENIGKNVILKVQTEKDYLLKVLKTNPTTGLFDPNGGAQLLEKGVATAKRNGVKDDDVKASVRTAYYMLLMIRRQLGAASTTLEQEASKRKPPKPPPPTV